MIFTSFDFLIFFLILLILYFTLRGRLVRQWILLIASFVFYGWWDVRFLALIGLVILTSYGAAQGFQRFPTHRKKILIFSLSITLGVLGVFKYFGFFADNLQALLSSVGVESEFTLINIILPVGVSFYTFQGISYIVDVYRKDIPAETNLLRVALYIAFFPQLVAGPIVRATEFIPQLETQRTVTGEDVSTGVREVLIGLIYKAIFADRIAIYVDQVFADIHAYDNVSIWIASFGFYSQIYFDFAGYSLMAIGFARLLGYNLSENFNYPYLAISITDFWRRWHISLSSWLRDYLYIPLGGNRNGLLMQNRNLMLTMLLGGLWHGASWNFVIWGALHGIALVTHKLYVMWRSSADDKSVEKDTRSFPRLAFMGAGIIFAWAVTQLFVFFCWVPFRLPSFSETWLAIQAMLFLREDLELERVLVPWAMFLPVWVDAFILGNRFRFERWLPECNLYIRVALMGAIFALLLMLVPLGVKAFIYFQF